VASRSGYELVLASAAVDFFASQSKRRQRRILDRVHELAADPFLVPDIRSTDSTDREIFQSMSDDFIFDYWVDHAAKQVIVTDIDHVE
jgi:hypothetical protein